MTSFPLKIVTPDGLIYDGEAEQLIVRTTSGDVAILARHINYVAPLGMGKAVVTAGGQRRSAACIGGMLTVYSGAVTLVATTFEWSDSIDVQRAEAAYHHAEQILQNPASTQTDLKLAEAKLRRALIRRNVASSD